jgi:hypothetical protein
VILLQPGKAFINKNDKYTFPVLYYNNIILISTKRKMHIL